MRQSDHFSRFSFTVMIIAIIAMQWLFLDRGYAEETGTEISTQEEDLPEIHSDQLQNRLEEIREILAVVEAEENEGTAEQLGTTLAELRERNTRLRNLEGIYQSTLTSLNRRDSLKKEEEGLLRAIESEQEKPVKEPPPYSLSVYDTYLDRLTAVEQKEQTASSALGFFQKRFEDVQYMYENGRRKIRSIREQIESGESETGLLVLNWDYEKARVEAELAQVMLQAYQIDRENLETEISLARLEEKIIKRDVGWVKSRLAFDQDDLEKHLGNIEERRSELRERLVTLMREQPVVEKKWLEAQKEVEQVQGKGDEVQTRADAFLKEREAWRETYQRVLRQTEVMIQFLNLEDRLWQRRYSLLKSDIDISELDTWEDEAEAFIERVEGGMRLVQTYQNSLQSQIAALEKQLSEEEIDRGIRQYREARLSALQKLAERNMEFLSFILEKRELHERFLDEIRSRTASISLEEKLEGLGKSIRGIWEFELWVINDRSVTIRKVMVALAIFIVGMALVRIVSGFISRRLSLSKRFDQTAASAISKVLYYFALTLLVFLALRTVNIPLTVFTFLGGAIAIGAGFGAQNLINNFISGFILMLERPVKIGDLIEVENNYGIIEEIGSRCTRIRTAGNIHMLVPNSSFLEKNIVNWTLADQEIRTQVKVGVAYGSDTRKVRKLLLRAAGEHGKILKTPEPFVLFSDFGENALIFELYFWIQIQRIMDRRMIESDIRFILDEHFREAGIAVAFPQRDVHLDASRPLEVRIERQSVRQ